MDTLIGKTTEELEALAVELGQPAFRGRQLSQGLYARAARDLESIKELPQAFRNKLSESCDTVTSKIRSKMEAPDGTVKYLLDLRDEEVIESVFLPYPGRVSVCISSQV